VVHLVAETVQDISDQLLTLMHQKGLDTTVHLPKPLRPKKQSGRRTPREMPWSGS
jgi:hypothetical protein